MRRAARLATVTAKTACSGAAPEQFADGSADRIGYSWRKTIRKSRQNSIAMFKHDAPDKAG
jgi:hypothetical protein